MYRRFHDRFGTAGVVIAVIALIAALGGTALAAGGLTGQQEKQVKKIAKKYAGKPGAPGAAGTNGTNGTNGKDGANGMNGEDGADGKSVLTSALAPGEGGCPEGGTEFEVEGSGSSEVVCNGEEGLQGEPGDPWTAGGTLPAGETETGAWGFEAPEGTFSRQVISFPIPLPQPIENVFNEETEEIEFFIRAVQVGGIAPAVCETEQTGTASASNPEADPGYICLYVGEGAASNSAVFNPATGTLGGSSTTGLMFTAESGASNRALGTFAVTAP